MLKKLLTIALCMTLILAGCGGGATSGSTAAPSPADQPSPADSTADSSDPAPAGDAPSPITEPITITMWHNRGEGANGDTLAASIEEFNATNEYGITVEAAFQGTYDELQAKIMQSIAGNTQPQIVMLSCNGVPMLASEDCLVDLTPYVERDSFDMDNFVEGLDAYIHYENQIISIPYVRSTALFYYNKALFPQAPTSMEELAEMSKQVYADTNGEVKGWAVDLQANYYQNALIRSLGSDGILDDDGLGAGCLEDGTMLKFLTDWVNWTEEGFFDIPALSNADSTNRENLYNGKVASICSSSGQAGNITKNAAENDIDLGIAFMPGYGGPVAPIGGGSLGIISKGNSEQQIAASWEFIKFLMSDDQVAANHKNTGYLPVTKSSVETDTVKTLWQENPGFKVAYEQLAHAVEISFSTYTSEWTSICKQAMSTAVQDRSQTPEQVVESLKAEAQIVFS